MPLLVRILPGSIPNGTVVAVVGHMFVMGQEIYMKKPMHLFLKSGQTETKSPMGLGVICQQRQKQ